MNISQRHIQSMKRIGTLSGVPVVEVVTSGGLHLVVTKKGGEQVTLGTGPHRAVARYIAKKREPDMVITELSKSDHVDDSVIESNTYLLELHERTTDALNALAKHLSE